RVLVEHYLLAFGPASRADIAQWGGIRRMGRIDSTLQALGDRLVSFKSEGGNTLYDLVDAPRPSGDLPASPRFLPKWDNLLLAYDNRERVLPACYRKTVIRINGDVMPTFLVDGMVAGMWAVAVNRNAALLTLKPFGPLEQAVRGTLEEEGARLVRFIEPEAESYEVRIDKC
ncbi:MAG: winged helix DNA-binding domain-containing protein, partial [Chloroflexi bacterium]|nr:winged helix DNA-binding domain-containing protein [Chloroflexota bacterium]